VACFPLRAWCAAAPDIELNRALLPRTSCGRAMVLDRLEAGSPAALEDACWHRLLPRSPGWLDGDRVVCGDHGLVFNAEGRCTHVPAQETLSPSACVPSDPVVASTVSIDLGLALAGTGAAQGDRRHGVNGLVRSTITPETDRAIPLRLAA
jgi:nitrite reductase/ring-hydroxylating ferredoxin subunit